MRDYRDKLRDLLEEIHGKDGTTRYRIAKLSGISEQTLSNVMHKRRNLSIDALQKLLDSLGYEIHFLPAAHQASTHSSAHTDASNESRESRA